MHHRPQSHIAADSVMQALEDMKGVQKNLGAGLRFGHRRHHR
jgi:hypothetical protein